MSGDLGNESIVDYHFGPYRFDGRLRRLYKDGEPVDLTPKAADTLVALLEQAGRLVEKDELLRAVWGDVVVGEDSLAQNISTLRRVFGDDPNSARFIATAPRRGYKFVATVHAAPSQPVDNGTHSRPKAPFAKGWWFAMAGVTTVTVGIAGFTLQRLSNDEDPRRTVEFTVPEPEAGRFSSGGGMLALSPDGEYLTFLLVDDGGSASLWLRPLASAAARRLDGTEGAANPFWSPDSRSIAFFSERRLKSVDVTSGAVRVVASLASARSLGGSWSPNGKVIFSVPDDGLYVVDATGGMPERIDLALEGRCDRCAILPYFLPDGRRFLYTVAASDTVPVGVYVGEIGKSDSQLVIDTLSSATYVAPGFLSYARSGTLYMHPFDPVALRFTGTPIPISDGVSYNARTGRVVAATSDAGVVAFRKAPTTELVWVDRSGRPEGIAAPAATYHDFAIAPDGRRVAVARVDPRTGTSDILVFDNGRGLRVTSDAAWDGDPVWSDDGESVAYSSRRGGRWQIYRRSATAVGAEELLLEADTPVAPLQVLRSNEIVYSAYSVNAPFDTWRLAGRESTPLGLLGGFNPGDARLSPDEQWVAYGKPETGGGSFRQTVYVSGLPFGGGETLRVVAEEASTPRWRADGRELFYLSTGTTVVALPVDPGRTPSDSAPNQLFAASGLPPTGISGHVYDVAPDGRRFLLKREVGSSPIHVLVYWDVRISR